MNPDQFQPNAWTAEELRDMRVGRLLRWYRSLRQARLAMGGSRNRRARRIRAREEEVWLQLDAILWVDRRLWRFDVDMEGGQ